MRDHISFTQINTYMICPLKYKFQYIDQLEWPFVPAGLLFGSAVHKALEHFYTGKKENRKISYKELWSIFEGSWMKEQKNRPIFYSSGDSEKRLFAVAEKLIKLITVQTHSRRILAIEKDFEIEIENTETGEKLELPLRGKIDLIEKDKDGTITVVDHKTAARKFTKVKIDYDLQMSCYAAVLHHHGMNKQNRIVYRFDVYLKNKSPEIVSYCTERTEGNVTVLFHIAKNVITAINNKIFYPNRGFYCSDCVFKDPCNNWKG